MLDGKGIYVGESARSMYERGREHEKDKEDRLVESHQIKHWQLDHPELEDPPKFHFKIVSTFKDPLTRQLAESVRIVSSASRLTRKLGRADRRLDRK